MDSDCAICFDPLNGHALFTTTCRHVFHYTCIRDHINHGINTNSPLCRDDIPQLVQSLPNQPIASQQPNQPGQLMSFNCTNNQIIK
jgi:hypothetical protein